MKIIKIIILALILQLAPIKAKAGDLELAQAFASFINTVSIAAQTSNKGSLICLYGEDEIAVRLRSSIPNVTILDMNIASKRNNYRNCKLIYVAKNTEKSVKSFIGVLNKSQALTVSAFESFVDDGGMIFIGLGRRDFELTVNEQNFKASGVRLDSSITALFINKSR